MRRVLIVAYAFPPVGASGAHRTLGFVRHLADHGWEPIVLTLRDPLDPVLELGLAERIPSEVPVIRTRWLDVRRGAKRLYHGLSLAMGASSTRRGASERLPSTEAADVLRRRLGAWLVPDDVVGWVPFGVAAGLRAVRALDVDAIYSTSPPPSSHLVALALRRLTGRPWVADFRDLWTENPYPQSQAVGRRTGWPAALERRLERAVLRHADHVVTVSHYLRDSLARRRGSLGGGPTHVITNGYDPEDHPAPSRKIQGRFTLCFTGTFYAREYLPFLRAVGLMKESNALRADEWQTRMFGGSDAEVRQAVSDLGLDGLVTVSGSIPHARALQEQVDATALLLIVDEKGGREGRLTGKVFEYMHARRPMLALVPQDSEVAALVRDTGTGIVVNPSDPTAIADTLKSLNDRFRKEGDLPWMGVEERVEAYGRPMLARQLAVILDEMVAPGSCRSGTAAREVHGGE